MFKLTGIDHDLLSSTAQGIVAKTSKVTYPIVPTITEQVSAVESDVDTVVNALAEVILI